MVADQSIKISQEAKDFLDSLKIIGRESYDDIILRIKQRYAKEKKK